ncbi:MAG: strawberry notch family protein, partial [Deltaproteobacteria bacterium]|nr:strawberry notch family protein [Deltaproteobacteria bacterium]
MLDAHTAADASARLPVPHTLPSVPAAPDSEPSAHDALFTAATTLLPVLEAGRALDAAALRDAMTRAFGAGDAQGAWVWKDAYEAAEAAVVLFIRRHGRAMRRHAGAGPEGPLAMLKMLEAVAALEPSHTKRSEEQIRLQQFSTPLPLAYAALRAAAVRPGDVVLEPSAGTGMLAVMAECALGRQAAGNLHLNEIADVRRALLCRLFPETLVTGVNAENVADRLPGARPTVVIMNPPFSATPGVHRIRHDADLRHLRSAFSMLPPGGRLAAVTSANCVPGDSDWTSAFGELDPPARVVFTMVVDGRVYARRGTGFDTRLTVLDRADRPGIDVDPDTRAENAAELLDAVIARVPPRMPVEVRTTVSVPGRDLFSNTATPSPSKRKNAPAPATPASTPAHDWGSVSELTVETGPPDSTADVAGTVSGPYESWRPGAFRTPGATAHPTPLVQSAAMAAVPHPAPSYRPMLPERVVTDGLLSDAQLESVVLAGQAHQGHLAASYRIGSSWETVQRCGDKDQGDAAVTDEGETLSAPVRFRRGWMLGDGTGCGKGR